jgi:hypothetical protein
MHRGGLQLQILAFSSAGQSTPWGKKRTDASRVAAVPLRGMAHGVSHGKKKQNERRAPGGATEIIDPCKQLCRPLRGLAGHVIPLRAMRGGFRRGALQGGRLSFPQAARLKPAATTNQNADLSDGSPRYAWPTTPWPCTIWCRAGPLLNQEGNKHVQAVLRRIRHPSFAIFPSGRKNHFNPY